MIRIFLTASFALMFVGAVAQSPTIRTQRNENNSVDFILENKTRPGTLTVFLTLRDLQNCNTASGTFRYETRYTGTRLLSLRPADDTRGVRYGYSYRFFLGPVDKEPDTAFVYRMPTTVRWPVRVSRGVSVYDRFRKEKKGALGLHFEMEKGDTVYAMRRGTVVEVGIPEREPDAPAVSFTSESPDLLVEQPDGTLAWYICLDGDNVLVEVGDEVLPGTPLALAGSYDGEYYKTAVQIYWYETDPDRDWNDGYAVSKRLFPRFQTTDGVLIPKHGGVYTPVFTPEMQTRELTAKELKKWRATHPGHKK